MFAAALDQVAAVEHAIGGDHATAVALLGAAAERYGELGWHHLAAGTAWQRARAGDDSGMDAAIAFYATRGADWRVRWLKEERWR